MSFKGLEPNNDQFANAYLYQKVVRDELIEQIRSDDDIPPKLKIFMIGLIGHINTLYQRDESLANSVKVLFDRR